MAAHHSDTGSFDREVVNSMYGAIENKDQLYMPGPGKRTRRPAGKLVVRGAARTYSKLPVPDKGGKSTLHGLLPESTPTDRVTGAAVMGAIKHIRLGPGRASTKKATKTSTPTSNL
jgi:hypothetical protein